jgi:hypothetical protein
MSNASRRTNEDEFFRMLEGVRIYLDVRKGGVTKDTISDEELNTLQDYAVYLERLNKLTIEQTGEEL